MKFRILLLLVIFTNYFSFSQIKCELTENIADSLGTYKSTKEVLMNERILGSSNDFIFFSLTNTDGVPALNFSMIQKRAEFIKLKCFGENSKIYFQLSNGKIIPFFFSSKTTTCGSDIRQAESKLNNHILTGSFLFVKETMQDLKESPIVAVRIKFESDVLDILAPDSLTSENSKITYQPSKFFIDFLKCVE